MIYFWIFSLVPKLRIYCLFLCEVKIYFRRTLPQSLPCSARKSRDFFAGERKIQNGCETCRRVLQEKSVWRLCSLIISEDGFGSYCSSCGYGLLLCSSWAKTKSRITRQTVRCGSIQNLERWRVSGDLFEDLRMFWSNILFDERFCLYFGDIEQRKHCPLYTWRLL